LKENFEIFEENSEIFEKSTEFLRKTPKFLRKTLKFWEKHRNFEENSEILRKTPNFWGKLRNFEENSEILRKTPKFLRKIPKIFKKSSAILTSFPILAMINNEISSPNLQFTHITSHIHKTQPSIYLQQFSHPTNFYSYLCIEKFPHGRSHNTTNPIHRHVDSDKKSEKEEKNIEKAFLTHPISNYINNEMIQLRLECLLMPNDSFRAIAIWLTVAFAIDNIPTAYEQN